eukprot:6209824-Pleurochrysis_carterae.AAC.6
MVARFLTEQRFPQGCSVASRYKWGAEHRPLPLDTKGILNIHELSTSSSSNNTVGASTRQNIVASWAHEGKTAPSR